MLVGSRDKDPHGGSRSPFCLPGPEHVSHGAVIMSLILQWSLCG